MNVSLSVWPWPQHTPQPQVKEEVGIEDVWMNEAEESTYLTRQVCINVSRRVMETSEKIETVQVTWPKYIHYVRAYSADVFL